MGRELVAKAGDQRPKSIIVKINREQLKMNVSGEKSRGWGYSQDERKDRNNPGASRDGLGGTESTRG